LLDPCPKIKLGKKIHEKKGKGKKRKEVIWLQKKQRGDQKLLKCKTIKSLLYEREETNYKKSIDPHHPSLYCLSGRSHFSFCFS
jgi:hypothetical protein